MNTIDYKKLISYKLAVIVADLTWAFVPKYYHRIEDSRQRDQMNQAARSYKQNIVEGTAQTSLSSKLKLYSVAKASSRELLEDYEDILRREKLPLWKKEDPRLKNRREEEELGELGKLEDLEETVNYSIDLLMRGGYLLDRQIAAVEEKNRTEGGYRENLLKKRLNFRRGLSVFLFFLLPLFILFLSSSSPVSAVNSGNFTLSLWVNPTTSVASKALASKAEEFRLFTNASGFVGCQIKTSTWQTAAQSATKNLILNTWNSVICTYDLTNLKVYVNGVLVATQALTSLPDDTAASLKLGQDDSASTTYTNLAGIIDEFKFYSYALTSDEVKVEYNHGSSLSLGSLSTNLSNSPVSSNSASAAYCIPGDSATCTPPVGEWNFEEGSGLYAQDTSGNSNLGTLGASTAAPTWTQGKVGKALKFDGSNDYVSVTSALLSGTTYTVSSWFKATSISDGKSIFSQRSSSNSSTIMGQLYISGSNIAFITRNDSSGNSALAKGTTTLQASTWYHAVGIRDGANVYIYLNGKLEGTDNDAGGTITSNTYDIGRYNAGGNISGYWLGQLDDVKIYNYARTPAQIAWDYNEGDPIAYWKMNECQGVTIHDSIGANTGTLTASTPGTCTDGTNTTNWSKGSAGKYGASLYFGGADFVSVANSLSTNSVAFWVKPTTNTASMINLTATQYISASSGAITATNFTSPIYYVNGQLTTSPILIANQWNHVVVTTATAITANAITIAKANSAYTTGYFDDVKIFNYALNATQVKTLYNENSAIRFGP